MRPTVPLEQPQPELLVDGFSDGSTLTLDGRFPSETPDFSNAEPQLGELKFGMIISITI